VPANWIRQSGSQQIIGSFNNGAVGTALLEAEALGVAAYRKGIEFPNPDYVALARACGAQGFRAAQPGELRATIEQALKVDGPVIIDCAVAADEMPNFPHIEVDQAGRYAIAKIKEALDSVVGR
jgi:pyruvate dehydrogenase (quinone)